MKTACIYHSPCMDGTAAAAAVRHRHPDVELLPRNHGDPVPTTIKGKRVYIVDFSYNPDTLRAMGEQAGELLWFDHHKTAIPIQDDVGFGVIDLNESGATLTWKQLFPDRPVPDILGYVRDKDIWLWELPDSREISAALSEADDILNPANPFWERLLAGLPASEWETLVERGRYSRRLLQRKYQEAATKGFAVELEGIRFFAVNWTSDASGLGEYIYKELGHQAALVFSYTGTQWSFSLRSDTVDVSEVAVKFGGGGHRGAAGFRRDDIEWLLSKRIP